MGLLDSSAPLARGAALVNSPCLDLRAADFPGLSSTGRGRRARRPVGRDRRSGIPSRGRRWVYDSWLTATSARTEGRTDTPGAAETRDGGRLERAVTVFLWSLVVLCVFVLARVLLLRLRSDREFTIKATLTKWLNIEVDSRPGRGRDDTPSPPSS